MLAMPLIPVSPFSTQHTSEDLTRYRPSRDLETFNSLLPPPIEFVEGSSSGALAVAEGKYEPINAAPKITKPEPSESSRNSAPTPAKPTPAPAKPANAKGASLYPGGIDITWPQSYTRGSGLYNTGNTCFLNSVLQCLLHTPPLLRILITHSKDSCRVEKGFCMSCSLRQVATQAHGSKQAFSPSPITNRLQTIAKDMRRGRQEDSHEFLRYAIDALQKSCLAGYPPKIEPKLAETTWVHKIFGGRLRSRVTCHDCGYNSDTFDRILDLSLDIVKCNTLKDALRKFIAIDYLKGNDKYKCEKCKKPVVAEKRFTIHDAPMVLTIHLKRFSPSGRKIAHHVDYDEHLPLHHYMSEGQFGPSYSLYGVICHAGSGPNSGHYYAFVKSADGRWWEMNDESVTPVRGPPTSEKFAYILFYMRTKGQGLEAAVKSAVSMQKNGLTAGMKKRKERENDDDREDTGEKVLKPIIGPLLPSATIIESKPESKRQRIDGADPQAAKIKAKIDAAAQKAKGALASLTGYESDSGSEEKSAGKEKEESKDKGDAASTHQTNGAKEKSSSPPPSESSPLPPVPAALAAPIPASSFYATSSTKKRRASENDDYKKNARQRLPNQSITNGYHTKPMIRDRYDPFKNLPTYGKKRGNRRAFGV